MYWFIPYAAVSIYHCAMCILGNQKQRAISKYALLPLLALAYFLAGGKTTFVFLALLFGYIGDIILIKPQEYAEKIKGSSFFAVGHIMYFIALFGRLKNHGFKTYYAFIVGLLIGIGLVVYTKVKDAIIEKMRVSCLGYFVLLSFMCGLSIVAYLMNQGLSYANGCALMAFGYAFFLASDTILVNQWFTVGDPHPSSDFKVMVTYCIAQFLIVYGLLI